MAVYLAATWDPRGELKRFRRLLPLLEELYVGLLVVFPPAVSSPVLQEAQELGFSIEPVEGDPVTGSLRRAVMAPEWSWGRYLALKKALLGRAEHLQYADMDRLIRWGETRPDELRSSVEAIERCDCLIFGRTPRAYRTHPNCLIRTEAISNRVVSHLLGQPMDVSAGSKAFSRKAAEFILANSRPQRAIGTDGEWPVLLTRAGFRIDYLEVDGLDWESADRYQEKAAGLEDQRRAARKVDQDPDNWAHRVGIALEIVESGLESFERRLVRVDHAR